MGRIKGPRFHLKPLFKMGANKDEMLEEVFEHFGADNVVRRLGLDRLLASLSPAQRKEVMKRPQEASK